MKWLVVLGLVAVLAWAARRQEAKEAEKQGRTLPPDDGDPPAGPG